MPIGNRAMYNAVLKTSPIRVPPSKLIKKARALQNRGQFQESLRVCEKLEKQGYESEELFHFHGLALRGCDQLQAALVKLNAALEINPQSATIYNSLGAVFLQMQDIETAIELFKHATKLDKKFFLAWKNLGNALRKAERYQAAVVAFTCAHHLDREQIEPLLNIVYIYIDVRRYKDAKELMDQILATAPGVTPDLLLKRLLIAVRLEDLDYIEEQYSKILRQDLEQDEISELDHCWVYFLESTGRYDEAIEILEESIQRGCKHQKAFMTHLGLCYAETGRIEDAIFLHEQMLEQYPDFIEGRYNLAFLQFKNGDLERGYENFEARWEWREFPSKRRQFDMPRWNGEPLAGKKLLVWREQGIGDEVRYASLLQDLQESKSIVTFECSPKLKATWENSFEWLRVCEEGPLNCINDPDYADFDFQIPVASLATYFRPTIASYDTLQSPWIRRDSAEESSVRDLLTIGTEEMLVGLCWRSSNQLASRDKYFLTCEQLRPFADFPNTKWLNVQYDAERDEIEKIRNLGMAMYHFTDVDQRDDIPTACTLLGACDLVITIGGSVADLVGGLGVPMIYMTARNSEVYLGTDYVPWFRNCKSYPIQQFKGSETIEKVAGDWSEISGWATSVSKNHSSISTHQPASLDLEYHE